MHFTVILLNCILTCLACLDTLLQQILRGENFMPLFRVAHKNSTKTLVN